MKIAVYAIAKNEAQFVQRWFESAKDADSIHILDTGSTDDTFTIASDLGIDVARWQFDPWRFDEARNLSLGMISSDTDMCIALDMDEVLQPGWRAEIERMFADGVTRPRYKYTWSWDDGGRPGLVYGGDKIHSRDGYVWKHPVHEVLTPCQDFEERQGWCDLEIHHHPDQSKSRSQYLPLLELAVIEDPTGDRNMHYLAREYFFEGRFAQAEIMFNRHLLMESAVWGAERSQSCRYLYKITKNIYWLHRAIAEAPDRREAYVDCAIHHYEREEWTETLNSALAALRIKERPLEYLTEADAWGEVPHDLAAISSYHKGYFHEARYHGMEAIKLAPYDTRLINNRKFYLEATR